ncbi:hypothetical protein Pan44_08040 [Caulifigura coniformis]|uniref:Uncharacterized protein n=1 Tax=Caulifigura coniformis TaxID=2527983 RepID=A0A517S9L0_9PLAN|nr:hypothetical protein [Caulifigura coniformis]QDT52792.1 hypothetical protein Pan44_08040 [Caulifigura coniformis]
MVDRRGLSQAMGLSSDKLAFITGKAPSPEVEDSTSELTFDVETSVSSAPVAEIETPGTSKPEHATARTRRPHRPRSSSRQADIKFTPEPVGLYGPIKVPLTIRLNPQTADALRRACLEQKLARRTPNSQQEIAEIAIAGWLREQGHL